MFEELKKIELEISQLQKELASKKIGFSIFKGLYLLTDDEIQKLELEIKSLEFTLIVKQITFSNLKIFVDFYSKIEKKGGLK